MTRQLIVVDTETTGLDTSFHVPLEVAAVNVDTGEHMTFVPQTPRGAFDQAAGDALQINRYFERGLFAARLNYEATWRAYADLWKMLEGNTFAGSNPAFDAAMLLRGVDVTRMEAGMWDDSIPHRAPWHHRLADLSAYAAGILEYPPTELPGLNLVCQAVGVENDAPHTALGDALATAECFRRLRKLATGDES